MYALLEISKDYGILGTYSRIKIRRVMLTSVLKTLLIFPPRNGGSLLSKAWHYYGVFTLDEKIIRLSQHSAKDQTNVISIK
jgi:hypothetical protein